MPKAKRSRPRASTSAGRTLDARPDTLDFRDLLYTPTLVEVPPIRPLARYRKTKVPVQDQGADGACTGFGLATTARQRELLAGPVGRALGVRWDELLSARPSASDLDLAMLAAALDLGAHPGLRDVVLQYIVQDDAPTRLERSGLVARK